MKDKSKCPTCCSEVNYHVEGGTSYYTPVDIKEMIEQAHMAGQIDAGVDPSYSNAQEYANKLRGRVMNLKEHLAVNVMGWRKNNYCDGIPCRDYYLFPEAKEGAWIDSADWNPTENIEQAFMCANALKEKKILRFTYLMGFVNCCLFRGVTNHYDILGEGQGKTEAESLSKAAARATGWEESA